MAHGQLHVAAGHLHVTEGTAFTHPDAVERSDDGVGDPVLVPRGAGEVLDGELLEPVRRQRRRDLPLVALLGGPLIGGLEHHRRAHVGHLLKATRLECLDGGIAGRGHDPFVVGQEVVGVGVEVGDPADQRSPGDEVVAVGEQLGHQVDVACVTLDQAVVGVVVVGLGHLAVLGVVVDPDHGVAPRQQLLDDVAADETR